MTINGVIMLASIKCCQVFVLLRCCCSSKPHAQGKVCSLKDSEYDVDPCVYFLRGTDEEASRAPDRRSTT